MNYYNYVSGEPISSPGSFSIDPNMRYQQMSQAQQSIANNQQVQIPGRVYTFGSAGYNTGASGAVGAPYMNGSMPFMNIPFAQQRPQYQDKIEHIDGFNPAGTNMLLPVDLEEVCDQLQLEMLEENEKAIAIRKSRIQGAFSYGGIYGWNSDYPDQDVINKYRRKAMEIRKEAMERRTNMNKYFSQLAHNYMEEKITDEDLSIIYDGYDRKITAVEFANNDKQKWLNNLKPYNNQSEYERHFNQLHDFYAKVSGTAMQGFLEGQGIIISCDNLEDEMHNRRNMGMYYNSNSYKRLLRKSIMEREGIEITPNQGPISPMNLPQFSTLAQSSKLLDDGTLSISAPSWVGKKIQMTNEMEAHFEENRQAFLQSIYAQDGGGK